MSNGIIFLLLVIIPTLVFGILMIVSQNKFLRSYRKIVNPAEPVSIDESVQNIINKPEGILKALADFNKHPSVVLKLYGAHYKNPILEKEAKSVRKYIILVIVVPILGFILAFTIALLR